jgi:hypothetical protein
LSVKAMTLPAPQMKENDELGRSLSFYVRPTIVTTYEIETARKRPD